MRKNIKLFMYREKMSLKEHTHKKKEEACMKKIQLNKFFIQVFGEKKTCEECGVGYDPLYNFYMISCCGTVMRVCSVCNWETVPCTSCKENNIGDIIINKKINHCDACAEEKIMFREIKTMQSNI